MSRIVVEDHSAETLLAEHESLAAWRALGKRLRTMAPEVYDAVSVVLQHAVDGTSPTPVEMDELDHVLGERLPGWRVLL